jgi:hypothetical protein
VAEFDPVSFAVDGLRSDGCIHTSAEGNAGIQELIDRLDVLWRPFCSVISRADFWVLAAKVAIEEGTPSIFCSSKKNNLIKEFAADNNELLAQSTRQESMDIKFRPLLKGIATILYFHLDTGEKIKALSRIMEKDFLMLKKAWTRFKRR